MVDSNLRWAENSSNEHAARRRVVFFIDRVTHYHVQTLRAIEHGLSQRGIAFTVLSSQDPDGAVGRTGLRGTLTTDHQHFELTERRVGSFTCRYQHGLLDLLKKLAPQVIVSCCHAGTMSEWRALLWARRNHVRRVAWQCGFEYNPSTLKNIVLRSFIPLFDLHLCYHSQARSYAIKHGACRSATRVMHNTIDESAIVRQPHCEAIAALHARSPESTGKRIVLYVGAILEEKRLDTVFAALRQLADPAIHFIIVGDGPYMNVLKQRYAQRTDWSAIGHVVDGVGLYFDAADVFVLPGTGGLAINQAMAHGLPVICGYADGRADDLVTHDVNGLRLQKSSAEELAGCILELLSDPNRAAAMGKVGEIRIRRELTFRRFIDTVVTALAEQAAAVSVSATSAASPGA